MRVLKFSQFDLKPQIKELVKRAGCYILIIKNEPKIEVRKPKQRSGIDEWRTNEQAKEPCLISKSHSWDTQFQSLTVERAAARPLVTSVSAQKGEPRGTAWAGGSASTRRMRSGLAPRLRTSRRGGRQTPARRRHSVGCKPRRTTVLPASARSAYMSQFKHS